MIFMLPPTERPGVTLVTDLQPATLTEEQAAVYLGIGVDLVRKLRRAGELPHIRLGERIVYYPPALDDFLLRKSQESVQAARGITRISR